MTSLFDAYSAVLAAGSAPATFDSFEARDRAGRARSDALAGHLSSLGSWVQRARARAQVRRATQALGRLDDRMLADIGISRGQIPYLVTRGVVDQRAANDDQRVALAG